MNKKSLVTLTTRGDRMKQFRCKFVQSFCNIDHYIKCSEMVYITKVVCKFTSIKLIGKVPGSNPAYFFGFWILIIHYKKYWIRCMHHLTMDMCFRKSVGQRVWMQTHSQCEWTPNLNMWSAFDGARAPSTSHFIFILSSQHSLHKHEGTL